MRATISQVLVDRRNRPDDLIASGAVVEMRFCPGRKTLSLRASKLLHLLVKAAGEDLTKTVKHKISLREVRSIAKISSAEIEEITMELMATTISVRIFQPKELVQIGVIISYVEIDLEDRTLEFNFSEMMQKVFADDDRWALLSKKLVLSFESKYALRLFEIIMLRRNLSPKSEDFELSDLRARLGVESGKLHLFADFRIYALDPAIAEINRLTDIKARYDTIKTGRAVTGIRLHWDEAEAPAKPAGRDSERKATETAKPATKPASAPFPGRGGIGYAEPWASIARKEAPGHDVDLIAAAFRDHCVRQKIPLRSKAIEATFAGFCRAYAERRRAASGV